jgi:hypothetical protein
MGGHQPGHRIAQRRNLFKPHFLRMVRDICTSTAMRAAFWQRPSSSR